MYCLRNGITDGRREKVFPKGDPERFPWVCRATASHIVNLTLSSKNCTPGSLNRGLKESENGVKWRLCILLRLIFRTQVIGEHDVNKSIKCEPFVPNMLLLCFGKLHIILKI